METSFPRRALGDVARVRSGFAFKSSDWTLSGIPVVKIANVKDGELVMDGCSFVDQGTANEASEWRLRKGDILLAMTGYIGDVARVRDDAPRLLNQRVGRFEILDKRSLDDDFLFYVLRSADMKKAVAGLGYGSAQPNVSPKLVHSIEIPLPALSEQLAIAGVLGTLDDKIEHSRRTSAALERLARAIFRAWFVDFEPVKSKAAGARSFPSMPQEVFDALPTRLVDSEIGPVPEGWGVSTLGEIIEIHDSKRIPLSSRERKERQGPYRYYGAAGIVDHVDSFLFDGIYLLLGEDGSVVDDAGRPVVQYVWGKFWVNNHAHVLTGVRGVSVEHLYLASRRVHILPFVTGAVQPKISQANLKRAPMVLAPGTVNITFGEIIAPLFALIRQAADESEKLAAMRDYLLPKLLSGSVRVREGAGLAGEAVTAASA